uniref:PIN domain-containing protein n=1 Tax=Cucumis sativus TaxID=3659 RepID=A0A0A0L2I2_CUCSA
MSHNKLFVKKTKSGKVMRSSVACLGASTSPILVLDTNVVLTQIGLLENSAIDDVVMLSVVLDEVKNKNLSVYNRVRALCSNPLWRFFVFFNEHHKDTYIKDMSGESKMIEMMEWYQNHLGGATCVLLITNDRENRRRAMEEGICAETIESYVRSLGQTHLLDLLVQSANEDANMEDVEDLRPSKRKVLYSEHKPMSEIASGLHRGIYHQGKLRVNRYNPFEAYVGSESIGDEIIIYRRTNMNRAFDGDVVAVELLSRDQWHEEKSLTIASMVGGLAGGRGQRRIRLGADDAPTAASSGDSSSSPRPAGRVIGIRKLNWHSYCGSLNPMSMPAGSGGFASAVFVSKDHQIPKIRIQTRQLENLLDKRIIVVVDSWDRLSRYPSEH